MGDGDAPLVYEFCTLCHDDDRDSGYGHRPYRHDSVPCVACEGCEVCDAYDDDHKEVAVAVHTYEVVVAADTSYDVVVLLDDADDDDGGGDKIKARIARE